MVVTGTHVHGTPVNKDAKQVLLIKGYCVPCVLRVTQSICRTSYSSCRKKRFPRWRHKMEAFYALLSLWEGNSPDTGGFPSQRPVTRCFDVFFDLRLNKQLSKKSERRWFETSPRSLWRDRNTLYYGRQYVITQKVKNMKYIPEMPNLLCPASI